MGEITSANIDNFINTMVDRDILAPQENIVIKAGTRLLRWAFSNGMIKRPDTGESPFFRGKTQAGNFSAYRRYHRFPGGMERHRAMLVNMLASVTE